MSDEDLIINPRIRVSIDEDIDHNVVLRFSDYGEHLGAEVFTYRITPEDQLAFLRDLANQISNSINSVARSIARGDCATCQNVRLVEEERHHGKMWQVHCPDCSPEGGGQPFEHYPIVGGGLAPRNEED